MSYVSAIRFTVIIQTGTIFWAATNANVYIRIIGCKGESDRIQLKNTVSGTKPFQVGKTDAFLVETVNIGTVSYHRHRHRPSSYLSSLSSLYSLPYSSSASKYVS